METITPQKIRDRAYAARVSINHLLKRAGVQNSTFWRWENGETADAHPVTLGKIADALEAIERERAA
jgi:transcriptional regulator with XRE-family HTH domain